MSEPRSKNERNERLPRVTETPPEFAGAVVTAEEEIEEIEEFEVLDDTPRRAASLVPGVAPRPAPPPAAPAGPPIPVATHKDANAATVLVVEDDDSIRAMIVRALALHYTVYEAVHGAHAVRVLERISPPACIVSDWMMPEMDGLELARRVRADKRWGRTPLIFLTAKSGALDVVQGINAGARHFIPKPFKMKELMEKVAGVVGTKK